MAPPSREPPDFQVLTGRKGKHISAGTASCRYFEQRRRFNQEV
jgi:hypothetical protein